MKNRLIPLIDKIFLRNRSIIETVNDQLKNISQIQHTRHRSVSNFLVNVIAGESSAEDGFPVAGDWRTRRV